MIEPTLNGEHDRLIRGGALLPRPINRHSREGGNPDKPFRSSGVSLWECRSCLGNLSLLPRRTGFPPSRE